MVGQDVRGQVACPSAEADGFIKFHPVLVEAEEAEVEYPVVLGPVAGPGAVVVDAPPGGPVLARMGRLLHFGAASQ